jgi:hypothetical protein
MHEVPFTTSQTKDLIKTIDQRLERDKAAKIEADWYRSDDFENDITALLSHLFPCSVLPGVRIFSGESIDHDHGYEVDNLLHVRSGGKDFIVIVEAKKQSISVKDGKWMVMYGDTEKDVLGQMNNHFRTLWEYLEPMAGSRNLSLVAFVVSSDSHTPHRVNKNGYLNSETQLCSLKEFPVLLKRRFGFLKGGGGAMEAKVPRVSQSTYLDLLRWGTPIPELGHPELTSAIRYVDRCRRELDLTLFNLFEPTEERWLINGSAGMGKSVLLAYAVAVLSTGYMIRRVQGDFYGDMADQKFEKMRFNPDPKAGRIIVMAMSQKQLDNLRGWYDDFAKKLSKASKMQRPYLEAVPEFVLFRKEKGFSGIQDCRALIIDESHDLPSQAAEELASLCSDGSPYLMLACDRHQRLRLGEENATFVKGLNFSLKSKRLRRIYRNPAPVYLASLAIMFRWFGKEGPKVIPTNKEFDTQFGLQAVNVGESVVIRMINDSHPANSWSHCVDSFPDAAIAFDFLMRERMRHKDVLWVRFSQEDPDFDYEKVASRFTYHNCRHYDSVDICDKYIKGQDFPVVVIEGFPSFMDRYEACEDGDDGKKRTAEEAEKRMWAFRRELYLCASRATTFLYFINHDRPGEEYERIRNEMEELTDALSAPKPSANGGSSLWGIHVGITEERRKQDVFHDLDPVEPLIEEAPIPPASDRHIPGVPVPEMEKTGSTILNATDLIPKNTPKELESAVLSNDQKPAQPKPQKPELKSFDALAGMVEPSEEPAAPKKQSTMKPLPRIGVAPLEHQPSSGNQEEESTSSDVANQTLASPKKEEPLPVIKMSRPFIVSAIAEKMGIEPKLLVESLKAMNVSCNPNSSITPDQAVRICKTYGYRFVRL